MSSAYLTSENMSMIERLLVGTHDFPRSQERDEAKIRFLVARFQAGITTETDLREALSVHIKATVGQESDLSRLISDGGVTRDVAAKLHKLLFGKKLLPSKIASVRQVLKTRPNEAQYMRLNDTDGRQRRENEIKNRNQMH